MNKFFGRRASVISTVPIKPVLDAERLYAEGFRSLRDFVSPTDVASIRTLVEPAFDKARSQGLALNDLGDGKDGGGAIVELERLADLEPRLKESVFFEKALAWSRAVLGDRTEYLFDHLIDKSPHTEQSTPWHQDSAHGPFLRRSARRIHWWLPLQNVDHLNGCLCFVPASHEGPQLKHERRPPGGSLEARLPANALITVSPLNLGDVSIHLPKTLHSAGPNLSADRRLAWIVHFGVRSWRPGSF